MRFEKGQLYKIYWLDITTGNEWQTEEEVDKWATNELVKVISEWKFLKKIGEWYLFYSGVSENEDPQYYDIHALPKGVIKKITKL